MTSNHSAPGFVEKISAFIGWRPGQTPGTSPGTGETGREFDAIMHRLDSGIAAYRKDMALLMESLNRRAA